jgi:phenylacetate-coenzyme A ligase PaaK-like adenylate-forming protein
MSIVHFLATTWDQHKLPSLLGSSGTCGHRVTALTDWQDILSKRTMYFTEMW